MRRRLRASWLSFPGESLVEVQVMDMIGAHQFMETDILSYLIVQSKRGWNKLTNQELSHLVQQFAAWNLIRITRLLWLVERHTKEIFIVSTSSEVLRGPFELKVSLIGNRHRNLWPLKLWDRLCSTVSQNEPAGVADIPHARVWRLQLS